MTISTRSVSLLGVAFLMMATTACTQKSAETTEASTEADQQTAEIDPNVFNIYLESRIQQPASQATAEQIEAIRSELTDLYLLSSTPRAAELKDGADLKARLEVQERALVAQAVVADFLASNPATDEEMQALYDEQVNLAPPVEFKARHILVQTEEEATDIIAQLDGGADFAELAKEKSTGPSGPSGGDLGWFPPERMVAEFSQAVQELEDGAYSKGPVQTQFGWHVILREDSRESAPPPFDSVRDALKQNVEGQKLQSYLESLRASAE
jgi:peptidyl-prolyl cis-trans isomerase C